MSPTAANEMLPLTHLAYHVLLALADVERHGYGIIKEVARGTNGEMELETGTLYAALKRLRDMGLIESVSASEVAAGADQRRRYYGLTALGRDVLAAESERMAHLLGIAAAKRVLPHGTA